MGDASRRDVFLLFAASKGDAGDQQQLTPRRAVDLCPGHREVVVKRTPLWRPPYFILAVSVLQVAVFAGGAVPALWLSFDPDRRLHAWRYVSYMLVHSDGVHLALNAVIQCLLALPLEGEQGSARTALVYLGGGLAGALATSALQPELHVVGASAGVYALLISHLANVLLRHEELRYACYRVVSVAVIAAGDVCFSVAHAAQGNTCPRVGWTAHCAGAASGLLLGLAVFRRGAEASCWRRRVSLCAALLAGVLALAALGGSLLSTPPPKAR